LLDRPRSFVCAFAQSNEGDVSPNICGPRCTENEKQDFERMKIVAEAQLTTARELYAIAKTKPPISGSIQMAHQYVDFGSIELSDKWHKHKECPPQTSPGCIGLSMLSGTKYDGRGIRIIPEGVRWCTKHWLTFVPQMQVMHKEKPIVFPTGSCGMSPSVLPLQLVTIAGKLAIAAVPFEATTMAGRRIRNTVKDALKMPTEDYGSVVIAGLSNAYCGYLTTREEYAVQRYEGASTHFGPNQLCATQQQLCHLAEAIISNSRPTTLATPLLQLNLGSASWNTPVIHDSVPEENIHFGDIVADKEIGLTRKPQFYTVGETVRATFHAAHPKNDLRTQSTFLEVHRWIGDENKGIWVMYSDDGDENTFYHWKRVGISSSQVTIEWLIPLNTPIGKYRLKHNGNYKRSWNSRKIQPYSGVSCTFHVIQSSANDEKENAIIPIEVSDSKAPAVRSKIHAKREPETDLLYHVVKNNSKRRRQVQDP